MNTFCIEMRDPSSEDISSLTEAMNTWQDEMVAYTQTEADRLGISFGAASHIIYLRSRSRWTQAEEDAMILAARVEEI